MLIRTIADIEALEAVPLDGRLFSRDVNDWIRRGLAQQPDKPALVNVPGADPQAEPEIITHRQLQARVTRAANLLRALKRDMQKKDGRVNHDKLRKDGYSERLLTKLEQA